jgi:hypothetical protein
MAMRSPGPGAPHDLVAARPGRKTSEPERGTLALWVLEQAFEGARLSQRDVLLMCLAALSDTEVRVAALRRLASRAGVRSVWSWNISDVLGRTPELATRGARGWSLTALGADEARRLAMSRMRPTRLQDYRELATSSA